jgi:hypothetical protein
MGIPLEGLERMGLWWLWSLKREYRDGTRAIASRCCASV